MKKTLLAIIIAILVSISAYFVYTIISKIQDKKEQKEYISQIPHFTFSTLDNKNFTQKDISEEAQFHLFIFFSPECEICHIEADELLKNHTALQNTSVYLVSKASINEIKEFAKQHNLSTINNIQILQDKNKEMDSHFKVKGVPYMILYNNSGKIIKEFHGGIDFNQILLEITKK